MPPQLPKALVRRIGVLAAIAMFSLLPASPAVANCGTRQLDGNWRLQHNAGTVYDITIVNGQISGLPQPATISQAISCKAQLSFANLIVVGSSEALARSSGTKPNRLFLANTAYGSDWVILHRR